MSDDDQVRFVSATEADASLMSTSATVHWEWFGTWSRAIANFMPRYAKNSIVKALFPVNVPFMFPMAEGGWGRDHYKIIDGQGGAGSVVLFKPKVSFGEGSASSRPAAADDLPTHRNGAAPPARRSGTAPRASSWPTTSAGTRRAPWHMFT